MSIISNNRQILLFQHRHDFSNRPSYFRVSRYPYHCRQFRAETKRISVLEQSCTPPSWHPCQRPGFKRDSSSNSPPGPIKREQSKQKVFAASTVYQGQDEGYPPQGVHGDQEEVTKAGASTLQRYQSKQDTRH